MTDVLNGPARALLAEPFLAHLATVDPAGTPHVTPVWVDSDGTDILVNTALGRRKARNMGPSAKVAVSVVDPADPYRVLSVQGTVAEVTQEGADAHIDQLASKYLGADSYPFRNPAETRVIVRINPDRVLMTPAG